MIVEEFVQILGLEIDDNGLQEFKSSIGSTIGKLGGLVAGAVSAAAAISSFLEAASEATTLTRFVRSIGVGIEEFQRLDFAARQAGGGARSLQNALARLTIGVGDGLSGRNTSFIEALGEMGIRATDSLSEARNSLDLLLEISKKVSSATGLEQNRLLSVTRSLGFGLDLGEFLKQGPDKIREIGREAIVVSKEMALASVEFSKSIEALRQSINGLLVSEGKPLIDWLTGVSTSLTTLVRGGLFEDLKDKFEKLSTSITSVPKVVGGVIGAGDSAISDGEESGFLSRAGSAAVVLGRKMREALEAINGAAAIVDQAFPFPNRESSGPPLSMISSSAIDSLKDITSALEFSQDMVRSHGLPAQPNLDRLSLAGRAPFAAGSGDTNIDVRNEVIINGSTDPLRTAFEIEQLTGDSLREQLDSIRSRIIK